MKNFTLVLLFLGTYIFGTIDGRFYKGKWFKDTNTNEGKNPQGLLSDLSVDAYWFNQTLDHFNPTDTRQWKQVRNDYFVMFNHLINH